jgi:hypothetical protein
MKFPQDKKKSLKPALYQFLIYSIASISTILASSPSRAATGMVDLGYYTLGAIPNEPYAGGGLLGINFATSWSETQFWGFRGAYLAGQDRVDANNFSNGLGPANSGSSSTTDTTNLWSVTAYYKIVFATTPLISPFVDFQVGSINFNQTCPKNATKQCIAPAPSGKSSIESGLGVGFYFPLFQYLMPYIQYTRFQTGIDGMREQNAFFIGINFNGLDPKDAKSSNGKSNGGSN